MTKAIEDMSEAEALEPKPKLIRMLNRREIERIIALIEGAPDDGVEVKVMGTNLVLTERERAIVREVFGYVLRPTSKRGADRMIVTATIASDDDDDDNGTVPIVDNAPPVNAKEWEAFQAFRAIFSKLGQSR